MPLSNSAYRFALAVLLACTGLFLPRLTAEDGARLIGLDGAAVDPFANRDAKLLVFVFTRRDCPVANAYAPEIQRLCAKFSPKGVAFCLVYADRDDSAAQIREHLREFGYSCAALRDPKQAFARRARAEVTPEAAVFRPNGDLLYHGRIDDRYVDFGKARPEPTRRDLAVALEDALAGRAVTRAAGPAVGCFIEGVK
jgi:hypothetical protein